MNNSDLVETELHVPLLWHNTWLHSGDALVCKATVVDTLLDTFHTRDLAVARLAKTAFTLTATPLPDSGPGGSSTGPDRYVAETRCGTPTAIQRLCVPIPFTRRPGDKIAITTAYEGDLTPLEAAHEFWVVDAEFVGKDQIAPHTGQYLVRHWLDVNPSGVVVRRTTANSVSMVVYRPDVGRVVGAVTTCRVFQPPAIHPLELLAKQVEGE